MELADPHIIAALIEAQRERGSKPRARRFQRRESDADSRSSRPRRCECGSCAFCIENARWDRIFNEKFADPDYYSRRKIGCGSSLGWLPAGPLSA